MFRSSQSGRNLPQKQPQLRKRRTLSRSKSLFFETSSSKQGGSSSSFSGSSHYKSFISLCSIPEHAQVEGKNVPARSGSSRISAEEEQQICHRSPVSFDNGYRKVVRITRPEPNPPPPSDCNGINDGLPSQGTADDEQKDEEKNVCDEKFVPQIVSTSVIKDDGMLFRVLRFLLRFVWFLLKVLVSLSSVVMLLICLLLLLMN